MSRPITEKEKYALGIFLIFLFYLFYQLVRPFVMTSMLAATIVVLSYPLFKIIRRAPFLRTHSRLASLLMTVIVLFTIIIPVTVVATIIGDQVIQIVQDLNLRQTFSSFLTSDFYIKYIEPQINRVELRLGTEINVLDYLTRFTRERVLGLSSYSPKVVLGTASTIVSFLIMLVTIFFLYIEGQRLFRFLIELSPLRDTHEMQLVDQFKATIRATIYGTVITSFVQSVLSFIAYVILGIPIALLLGVLTFFMSLIPFVGTSGVWIPVSIWLFLQGRVWAGLGMLLYGLLVVGLVDNFLKPVLIRGKTNNHPLLIFFSLIGGISLMGPFGIFYGPVILASLIATITMYRREVLKKDE